MDPLHEQTIWEIGENKVGDALDDLSLVVAPDPLTFRVRFERHEDQRHIRAFVNDEKVGKVKIYQRPGYQDWNPPRQLIFRCPRVHSYRVVVGALRDSEQTLADIQDNRWQRKAITHAIGAYLRHYQGVQT
jgi:hypothetical protein